MMGTGSPAGPSSRRCTFIPAICTNLEGGGAQRAASTATGWMGAQLVATATPMMSTTTVTAAVRIFVRVFIATSRPAHTRALRHLSYRKMIPEVSRGDTRARVIAPVPMRFHTNGRIDYSGTIQYQMKTYHFRIPKLTGRTA